MKKKAIRIIALIMAGLFVLSALAALVFAEEDTPLKKSEFFDAEGIQAVSSFDYDEDELVDVIIEFEGNAVLDDGSVYDNADLKLNKRAKALDESLASFQQKTVSSINKKVLDGEALDIKYSYTYLLNAVSAKVPYGKIEEIALSDGVKDVYIDKARTVVFPKMEDALFMTNVGSLNNFGLSAYGIGSAIGIIDTGIDTDHEAFAQDVRLAKYQKANIENILSTMDLNAEKAQLHLSADDVYLSSKLPFVFDYAEKDTDVNHRSAKGTVSDHGTHVSAIAAGLTLDEDESLVFSGNAPYSQLAVFKVFSVNEKGEQECKLSDLFAAMEDAIMLGLDVVNMSIGWNVGFGDYTGNKELEPLNKIAQRIENSGVVFVGAAGNESGSGYQNLTNYDRNPIDYMDIGTIAAPSSYDNIMSVGSVNNSKINASAEGEQQYQDAGLISKTSSWGPTSDLKIKPDFVATGGSVYSATDPEVSGKNYGLRSGTSMASPQIAGAVALLKKHYSATMPRMTPREFSLFVRQQIMGTSKPVKQENGTYYSPRVQGAGLVDIYAASFSKLTVTVGDSLYPKAELGDDPEKTGVYTIKFKVKNNTEENLVYKIQPTLLTETIFAEMYIGQISSDVTREAEITSSVEDFVISLEAGEEKEAEITIKINDFLRGMLDNFTNGAYVDGFIRLLPQNSDTVCEYTIPFLAFYGDWDRSPMMETANYKDVLTNSDNMPITTYPNALVTTRNDVEDRVFYVGENPVHEQNGIYIEDYNVISPDGDGYYDTLEIYVNLLRNAKSLKVTITDRNTGEVYLEKEQYAVSKSIFDPEKGGIVPYSIFADNDEAPWAGTDSHGNTLKNGTQCMVTVTASLARDGYNSSDNLNDTFSFPVNIDTEKPKILSVIKDDANIVAVEARDNMYIADIIILSADGKTQLARMEDTQLSRNCVMSTVASIEGHEEAIAVVTDFAWNQTIYHFGDTKTVEIDQGETSVHVGDEITFTAKGYSENGGFGYDESMVWTSSDETIATIDKSSGQVKTLKAGDVQITATGETSGVSGTVTLHVVPEDAQITPKPSEKIALTSGSEYTLDEYVGNVEEKTTVEDFLKNFTAGGELAVFDSNGNKKAGTDLVGTGDLLCHTVSGELWEEIVIMVLGDITGDGNVNSRDIAMLQRAILGTATLTGVYRTAADMNMDSKINSRDIASVQRVILG